MCRQSWAEIRQCVRAATLRGETHQIANGLPCYVKRAETIFRANATLLHACNLASNNGFELYGRRPDDCRGSPESGEGETHTVSGT